MSGHRAVTVGAAPPPRFDAPGRGGDAAPTLVWAIFVLLFSFLLLSPAQDLKTPPLQLQTLPRQTVRVQEFRFEGNTVFTAKELATVAAPFTDRELAVEELEDARRAVTLHYVNHGYINSGAVLPEQKVTAGIVILKIVEGGLTDVAVTGNKWLRDGYILSRVRHAAGLRRAEAATSAQAGAPLNIFELKEGLQLLRLNPNVSQVNAELQPGALPGESRLELRVVDHHPFRLGLQADNARPPSVGSMELLLLAGDRNLTGHSDSLAIAYGIVQGGMAGFESSELDNVEGSYTLPLTASDTTLQVHGSKKDFTVVEEPFDELDIESESHLYGVWLRQPLYRTSRRELAVAIGFDRRHSESTLLGVPFNLSPGAVNGEIDLSVLRFTQEWIDRGFNQVFAARSTLSVGLDAFGTTDDGTTRDAKFVAWLGQVQYVRRLFGTPNQLILRADGQLTGDKLLALEQFSIGGINSVRGYRENQLVRDCGVFGSIELRLPVLFDRQRNPLVQFAPFVDFGGVWNVGDSGQPTTIGSAGIGLLLTPHRQVSAQLYWGWAFRDFDTSEDDPQDLGLHFRVVADAF